MTGKRLLFLILLFVACFSPSSHLTDITAATSTSVFYVDNSGSPPCSDSPTNGSEENPWCTISYAASQISGGDTVFVKNGTYANPGVIIQDLAATAESPTRFAAFSGHSPVIEGAGVHTGRVRINNASHAVLEGFTLTQMNHCIFVDNSSNVTVRNNTCHFIGQEAIHVFNNSSFVTVEVNTVFDTGKYNDLNGEGFYIGSGSTAPLDNTNNVVIRDNTIHDTTHEAIELKPGTHDCTVEGNTIYVGGTAFTDNSVGRGIEFERRDLGNQTYSGNPAHLVRNNILHSMGTAIRVGSGVTIYNNLIYNITASHRGILVTNPDGDSFTRFIYHNTVDHPSADAIVVAAGTADVKNNIGPTTTDNLATSDSYYVDKAAADYHLVAGSAPVNAGLDLTETVPTDLENNSRSTSPPPDLGAYELTDGSRPDPPANLRVIEP